MGFSTKYSKPLLALIFSSLMVACGGGGNNSNTNPNDNSSDNNSTDTVSGYTGLKTEADLDSQLAREAANDYIFIRNFIQSILLSGLYSRDRNSFQSGLNVSENCSGGGVVHLSTTSNINNSNGVSNVAFDNCVDDNQTMHGDIVLTMNYTADTLNVRWNNLMFQEGNNQLVMKGLFDYKLRKNNMNVSLLASDSDNRQLLVDSLRVPLPQDRINPDITDYFGDFYYSDKGHIKVNSESPLGSSQQNGYPSGGGPLIVSDTSGSKATFVAEGNNVIFNYLPSGTSRNPVFGRLPWDKLESEPSASGVKPIARELFSGSSSSISFRRFFFEAENIKLDGSASSGSDGTALSFEWKIIKAPDNSTATISQSNTVTPVFHPDYLGEYHIEQTVFDGFLKSDPKLIKVFLGTDSSVYLGSPYKEITQPGGEVTSRVIGNDGITGHEVFIHAFNDSGSIPDFLKFNLKWELIEKPENSNFRLTDDFLRDWSFTPDKAGEYVFNLTINRGQNNDSSKLFLTVHDYQDVAFPRIVRITGHNVVNINQPVELEIEQHISAGPP